METLIILPVFLIPALGPLTIAFFVTRWFGRKRQYGYGFLAGLVTTTVLLVAELLLLLPSQLRCDFGLERCGGDGGISFWGISYVVLVLILTAFLLIVCLWNWSLAHGQTNQP